MQVDEIGQDQFDRMRSRQKKAWEEIENGLAIIYPSSQGKDKQARYMIFSELTGSTSELKIQGLPPDQLERIALAVREFGRDVLAGVTIETPPKYIRSIYDRLAEEETRQTDNAQHEASDPPVKAATLDTPATKPQSASEFAKNMADKMTDQFDEGLIGNLQPYQGTKPYQKGCRPGYFDLEDGQGGLVRKFKYLDPDLDVSSGLKRVYYRTETYHGKTSFAVTKIEPLD